MGSPDPIGKSVVLFDGVCNLCNHSVQFIIRRDKKGRFLFAALQSDFGKKHLEGQGIPTENLETIVLVKGEKVYQRSDAILEIVRQLSGLWPMLYVFKLVPKIIRDWVYDFVARHRYQWFGRKDQCMIPTPELKMRFLN